LKVSFVAKASKEKQNMTLEYGYRVPPHLLPPESGLLGAWKAARWIWEENSSKMELCGARDGPCHGAPTCKQIARNRPLDCRMSLEMSRRSLVGPVESFWAEDYLLFSWMGRVGFIWVFVWWSPKVGIW
jgi:hypothetical protein